jgi:ATP-dependent Zn protease
MENIDPQHTESGEAPKPIEKDYESHKADPGPAKPAVTEKDENGAGQALKWILPIIIIIGLIVWFAMRK